MNRLVDTDVVIDYLKGTPGAVRTVDRLFHGGIGISIVTDGEILDGIHQSRDTAVDHQRFEELLEAVPVVSLTTTTMTIFARLRGTLRSQGQLIPDFDLLIAATAIELNVPLVTRNRRHFDRVPGLTVEDLDR